MVVKWKFCLSFLLPTLALLLVPVPAISQGHGGGGGGGCGDVFGDLIHILRDGRTGQPILAQRWVELPAAEQGYGWGYCPIAVYKDEDGIQQEIPFLPYSCDMDPVEAVNAVEVDYFGRLNGGRTKERNNRMHFDEVISNITQADVVTTESTGRLELGFRCQFDRQGDLIGCYEWNTVDSPMENLSLYTRLMEYSHLQTYPLEEDAWAHGDPNLGTQYHPALTSDDWKKFDAKLHHLLPDHNANLCWDKSDDFDVNCADPQDLEADDFLSASVYLAAAANKTGIITVDLVQYINRFLKITQDTGHTYANSNLLPAPYRDCWGQDAIDPENVPDNPPESGEIEDPAYFAPEACLIIPADPLVTPRYGLYPNIQELFVDFGEMRYQRNQYSGKVDVILDLNRDGAWQLTPEQKLLNWIEFINGKNFSALDIDGFVDSASDVLRSIEYVHNFAPPEYLHCLYVPEYCQ